MINFIKKIIQRIKLELAYRKALKTAKDHNPFIY